MLFFISVLYIIMISFKIQDLLQICIRNLFDIVRFFLSAHKISPSVGCKSTNHGPGTTALSCQAPGSLHAGAAAVAVKYQQLIFGKTIFLILFFLKIFLQLSVWNIYRVPDMSLL